MARQVSIGLIPQIIEEGPVPNNGLYLTMLIPDDATEAELQANVDFVLADMGEYITKKGFVDGLYDDSASFNKFAEKIKELFVNGQ